MSMPTLMQQFLARLGQHWQSIVNPLGISGTPAGQGVVPAVEQAGLGALNATFGTVGLGLEGTRALGEMGASAVPFVTDVTPLRNLLPPDVAARLDAMVNQAAARAAADPLGQGFQAERDLTAQARTLDSTPLSWATGAAALGLDPANYLGGLLKAARAVPVLGQALAVPDFALNAAPEAVTGAVGKALAPLVAKVAPAAAPAAADALRREVIPAGEAALAPLAERAAPALTPGADRAALEAQMEAATQAWAAAPEGSSRRAALLTQMGSLAQQLAAPAAQPAAPDVTQAAESALAPLAQDAAQAAARRMPAAQYSALAALSPRGAARAVDEIELPGGGVIARKDYAALKALGIPDEAIQGYTPRVTTLPTAAETPPGALPAATTPDTSPAPLAAPGGAESATRALTGQPPQEASGQSAADNLARFMAGAHPAMLNPDGTPKVLYHGNPAEGDFDTFRVGPRGVFGTGIYFTDDPTTAAYYALGEPGDFEDFNLAGQTSAPVGAKVKPAYVNLKNPVDYSAIPEDVVAAADDELSPEQADAAISDWARAQGYDGIIAESARHPGTREYIAFAPEQVKSAIGNRGTYDPNDPSILHFLPQNLPNVGVATAGAAGLGALGGFALPAGSTQDRLDHAGEGAALGTGLGLGLDNSVTGDLLKLAAQRGAAAQRAAFTEGVRPGLRDLPALWKRGVTETPRNVIQEITGLLGFAKDAGYSLEQLRPVWQDVVEQMTRGAADAGPNGYLPTPLQDWLGAFGLQDRLLNVGRSILQEDPKYAKQYNPFAAAAVGGLMSGATGTAAGVPLAGAALGAGLGFVSAFRNEAFKTIVNALHDTVRYGALKQGIDAALANTAPAFLQRLADAGIDVSSLAAKDGAFTPADVAKVAGPRAAEAWRTLGGQALAQSEPQVRQALLDFTSPKMKARFAQQALGIAPADWDALPAAARAAKLREAGVPLSAADQIERAGVGALVPYIGWALRAYPRTMQLALNHPNAALALTNLYLADRQSAYQAGKPMYAVGSLPLSDKTPLVGKLVDLLTGGQGGYGYLNPLQALSPAQPNAVNAGQQFSEDTNAYQKVSDALGLGGFQFNPLIQDAAYAAGLAASPALPLSRTSEIEQAMAPGGYQRPGSLDVLPSLLDGPLRAARSLATGQQVAPPDDPATKFAQERAIADTGLPLGDPRNLPLAHQANDHTSAVYAAAKQRADIQMLAKGIIGLVSPVTISPQTAQQHATAQAEAALLPFPPMQIAQERQRDPERAVAMERANQYALAALLHNPQTAGAAQQALAYEDTGANGDERLYQFARQYAGLRAIAPTLYNSLLAQYARQIGVVPDTGGGSPLVGKPNP